MEVLLCREDPSLVLRNALDLITPLTGDLDTGLDRLRTGVHGQDHVEAKVLGHELGKTGKDIVVEGTGTESQTGGLIDESRHQLGVAVTLVDSGVRRQEIEVLTTLGVPDCGALGTSEDDRKWVVVVGSEVFLSLDGLLSSRGMVGTDAIVAVSSIGTVGRHGGERRIKGQFKGSSVSEDEGI